MRTTLHTAARTLAAALALLLAAGAWAGSTCTETAPTPDSVRKSLTLALRTAQALDQSGAQVAFIARVGQDLSKYHLRYSHFGYVEHDAATGRWVVTHELNQCGTARSAIYRQGLGNFFLDDMFAYDTLIIVPGADTQRRLAAALAGSEPTALHGLPYNMLAYAYSTRYQNSNQWGLELYAAAVARDAPVRSRLQAQDWLKAAGYQPITVQIDALTRLGARLFRANIAFDDHSFDRRMAGQIDTVTVESAYRFIEAREPGAREIHLSLEPDGQARATSAGTVGAGG